MSHAVALARRHNAAASAVSAAARPPCCRVMASASHRAGACIRARRASATAATADAGSSMPAAAAGVVVVVASVNRQPPSVPPFPHPPLPSHCAVIQCASTTPPGHRRRCIAAGRCTVKLLSPCHHAHRSGGRTVSQCTAWNALEMGSSRRGGEMVISGSKSGNTICVLKCNSPKES